MPGASAALSASLPRPCNHQRWPLLCRRLGQGSTWAWLDPGSRSSASSWHQPALEASDGAPSVPRLFMCKAGPAAGASSRGHSLELLNAYAKYASSAFGGGAPWRQSDQLGAARMASFPTVFWKMFSRRVTLTYKPVTPRTNIWIFYLLASEARIRQMKSSFPCYHIHMNFVS